MAARTRSESIAGLGGGGGAELSVVLAGVELWPEPSLVDDSVLLGGAAAGGGIDCDVESGMTGTCAACAPPLVEVPFIEAQPETERTARNPAITNRRIDGSPYPEGRRLEDQLRRASLAALTHAILHHQHAARTVPREFTDQGSRSNKVRQRRPG